MANTTKIVTQTLAALAIFIFGIATGVMLMQANPRNPNLSWLKALNDKSQDKVNQVTCPAIEPEESAPQK